MSEESIPDEEPKVDAHAQKPPITGSSSPSFFGAVPVPVPAHLHLISAPTNGTGRWTFSSDALPEPVDETREVARVITNRTDRRIEAITWMSLDEIPTDQRERRRLVSAKLQALGDALLAAMERVTAEKDR